MSQGNHQRDAILKQLKRLEEAVCAVTIALLAIFIVLLLK